MRLEFVLLLIISSSMWELQVSCAAAKQRDVGGNVNWYSERLGSSNFSCSDLSLMMHKKEKVLKTLDQRIEEIRTQFSITPEEKLNMEILQLYQRELKATGTSLVTVLLDLNRTLSSGSSSLDKIKRSCQVRLDDMRNAAVFVEEDYNTILGLEEEMKSLNPNMSLQTHYQVINEILTDISHAADTLEKMLREDLFGDLKKTQGAAFETVVKLRDDEELYEPHLVHKKLQEATEKDKRDHNGGQQGIPILIDSTNNQYILSRPRDVTVSVADHRLLHDIVCLLLLSFLLAGVCSLLRVPYLFAYMFAGMLLGPVGYNVIGSVVQVETIGEFGVIFIVFMIGLEFSPEQLRKVWHVSVYGGNLLLVVSVILGVALGLFLNVHPRQSLFVVVCLFLSSTPLAMRLIDGAGTTLRRRTPADDHPREELESDITNSLLGILVMQDIQLGTLMALMPFFASGQSHHGKYSFVNGAIQFVQIVFGLFLLAAIARWMTTKILDKFYRLLSSEHNKSESVLVGSVAMCFLLLMVAELVGASLELGCLLAGVAISSQGHSVVEQVQRLVEPVRHFFTVFFFASIGFHVFPTFLMSEFSMIFTVTFCVIALKFLLAVGVLGFFLSGHCHSATWIITFALTPVSEFSFVLASRGRRVGIISREVYLVILSIAALSLLLAPLLWRLTLLTLSIRKASIRWRSKLKKEHFIFK